MTGSASQLNSRPHAAEVPEQLPAFRRLLEARPFRPSPWLPSAHLQTVVAAYAVRRQAERFLASCRRLEIHLKDGARVEAEYLESAPGAPVLVAVHGMGGSSRSSYMRGFGWKAGCRGWNALLLNLYNCNRSLDPPRIFHAGASDGLLEILENSVLRYPQPVFLAGVSLGGNIVLRMLGELGGRVPSQIRAAGLISPLSDLTTSWQVLDLPLNRPYRLHYVRGLKRKLEQYFRTDWMDRAALARVRSIRQYDELVTAPLAGFSSALEYYRMVSSAPLLKKVRTPTLILHSADDFLLSPEPFLRPEARANDRLLTHITRRGGHVGFLAARRSEEPDNRWAENRCVDFFEHHL